MYFVRIDPLCDDSIKMEIANRYKSKCLRRSNAKSLTACAKGLRMTDLSRSECVNDAHGHFLTVRNEIHQNTTTMNTCLQKRATTSDPGVPDCTRHHEKAFTNFETWERTKNDPSRNNRISDTSLHTRNRITSTVLLRTIRQKKKKRTLDSRDCQPESWNENAEMKTRTSHRGECEWIATLPKVKTPGSICTALKAPQSPLADRS